MSARESGWMVEAAHEKPMRQGERGRGGRLSIRLMLSIGQIGWMDGW